MAHRIRWRNRAEAQAGGRGARNEVTQADTAEWDFDNTADRYASAQVRPAVTDLATQPGCTNPATTSHYPAKGTQGPGARGLGSAAAHRYNARYWPSHKAATHLESSYQLSGTGHRVRCKYARHIWPL